MVIKGEDNLTNKEYNKLIIRKVIEWFIYIGCILSLYVYQVCYSWIYGDQFTFFLMPTYLLTLFSIFWMPVVVAMFDRKYYKKWYLILKLSLYLFGIAIVARIVVSTIIFLGGDAGVDLYKLRSVVILLIPILEIIYLLARKLLKKM